MTAARPRVLEIGMFCLFKQAWPETTTFVFAGPERFLVGSERPKRFRFADWLRPGAFDLVVAHTAVEEPCRPDVWLRLLSPKRFADRIAALQWELMRQFRPRLGPVPLAVLDLHDERKISRRDVALLGASTLYFKRELPPDPLSAFHVSQRTPYVRRWVDKIRPLSLGLSAATLADLPEANGPKTVDVFFGGSIAHGAAIRAPGLTELEQLSRQGVVVDVARVRLPRRDYLVRCARARLVWSPEGLGWDCFRHYEAAACGAVPLINQPTIRRHAPLIEGELALHYDVEPGGLTRAVRAALADPARLDVMGQRARAHVLANHTHDALCRAVADACLQRPRSALRRAPSATRMDSIAE